MKVEVKKTYVAIIELTEADATALIEVLEHTQEHREGGLSASMSVLRDRLVETGA